MHRIRRAVQVVPPFCVMRVQLAVQMFVEEDLPQERPICWILLKWLRRSEEKDIGFDVGLGKVPIVPAACLFDLEVGNPKCRPDADMGYTACVASENNHPEKGNFGAGTGATVGKFLGIERLMKGGLGTYAVQRRNAVSLLPWLIMDMPQQSSLCILRLTETAYSILQRVM